MAINKNKVMEAAQKLVEKGQIDKAIKEYLKVVQDDAKDVRVWLKIGDLYAKKGAKPEATETYLKVAQFYGEQGFYLKAVAVYKQVLKLDPRLVDVNMKLADLYRQLGLMSDAVQQYELVAAFYNREGKTKEALATIRALCDLDPDNVATRIKLAELYSKENMVAEAVGEFSRAAEYLRQHNRIDDYIKVAERLVWHKPGDIHTNRDLAQLYLKRNDARHALQKLQVCFKTDPRDVETLALLAAAFQALDQLSKTVSVLKELARVHSENGNQSQALEVWRQILVLAPDDADALALVGRRSGSHPAADEAAVPAAAPPYAVATPIVTGPPVPTGGAPRIATPIGGAATVRLGPQGTGAVSPVEFRHPAAAVAPEPDTARPAGGRRPEVRSTGRSLDFDVDMDMDDIGVADEVVLEAGADPAEAHADEIARILTETDVYVKYGLHQKAVEHLKRVFDLDPRNVEAHEKLKDIYLALGQEEEALAELYQLVELTAVSAADQAVMYARECLTLAPHDPRAAGISARFHLPVPPARPRPGRDRSDEPTAVGEEPREPPEEQVSVDFEEVLEEPTPLPDDLPEVAVEAAASADVAVDFEFDDLGSRPAQGLEPGDDHGTAQVEPAQLEAEILLDAAIDPDTDLVFEDSEVPTGPNTRDATPRPRIELDGGDEFAVEPSDFGVAADHGELPPGFPAEDEFEAEFDNPEYATERRHAGPPAEPGLHYAGPGHVGRQRADFEPDVVTATAETDVPELQASFDDLGEIEPAIADVTLDPADQAFTESLGGEHTAPPVPVPSPMPALGSQGVRAADLPGDEPELPLTQPGADTAAREAGSGSLEDELDEADFFITQGLYEEARGILAELLERHPQHPLLLTKLQDLDALEQGEGEPPALSTEDESPALAMRTPVVDGDTDTPAVGLETPLPGLALPVAGAETPIPATGATPSPDERAAAVVAGAVAAAAAVASAGHRPQKRQVVIAKPLGEEDAATHWDLGLAYKEMGLFEEAIKEFKLLLETPGRSVVSHQMIGLCHAATGKWTDAITEYKKGLNVEGIADREALDLYFELGSAYDSLGDFREAMYYYEKVSKRDAHYRDVERRTAAVKAREASTGRSNGKSRTDGGPKDEAQAALDALTEGRDEDFPPR